LPPLAWWRCSHQAALSQSISQKLCQCPRRFCLPFCSDVPGKRMNCAFHENPKDQVGVAAIITE
jgi:hypothetical protein